MFAPFTVFSRTSPHGPDSDRGGLPRLLLLHTGGAAHGHALRSAAGQVAEPRALFFVGSGFRGVQNLDQDLIFSDPPHCIWQKGFRAILFLGGSRICFPRAGSGS